MKKDEAESVLVTDAAEEGKGESEDEENNEDNESEYEDSEEDEQAEEGWNADQLHASRMPAGGVGQALAYAGETRWM